MSAFGGIRVYRVPHQLSNYGEIRQVGKEDRMTHNGRIAMYLTGATIVILTILFFTLVVSGILAVSSFIAFAIAAILFTGWGLAKAFRQ